MLAPRYSHFTVILISWKAYEALDIDDVEQAESVLRKLARELKDMQLVRTYPQLSKLVDLLPLLPALRHVRDLLRESELSVEGAGDPFSASPMQTQASGTEVSGASWWDRALRWQQALTQVDTPATRAAAERLSRCLEGWLVEAGMIACQQLAHATAMPLPGALAVPAPSAGRSQPASSAPGHDPSPVETAPAPLAAGVTLGVLGAASLAYGTWRCVRGTRDYRVVGTPQVMPNGSRASATTRAMPFVVGVASLTAGACLVYPYLSAWLTPINDAEQTAWFDPEVIAQMRLTHPDLAQAVEALDLPDWGSIHQDMSSDAQLPPRVAREAAIKATPPPPHPDMASWLRHVVEHSNLESQTQTQFALLIVRCMNSPCVKSGGDQEERETRVLVKLLQSLMELARDETYLAQDEHRGRRLQEIWSALLPSYESFSYREYGKLLRDFGRLFLVDSTLNVWDGKNVPLPAILPSLTDQAQQEGEDAIRRLYTPVLDPVLFIDQFIRDGIALYQARTGKGKGLTPTSKLVVRLQPVWDGNTSFVAREFRNLMRPFTLREIVTGQHHYAISKIESIYAYRIASIEPCEPAAVSRSSGQQRILHSSAWPQNGVDPEHR